MSLYGSLIAGVAGLKAQTQSMATIADNIANVNTVGYKRTTSYFATLVTGAGSTTFYSPGGLRATPHALIDQQGVLQATQRATDVAVLGRGFLVVNAQGDGAGEQLFTRAGSFSEDNQGRLVNGAGYFLQGWALDQQGNIADINTIETVSVGTLNGVAVDTTSVQLGANVDAATVASAPFSGLTTATYAFADADTLAGTSSVDFRRDIRAFDSLGTPHNLSLSLQKLGGVNGWAYSISTPDATAIGGSANNLIAFGTLAFNGDGSIGIVQASTTAAAPAVVAAQSDGSLQATIPVPWINGASASAIDFNFGTQNLTDGFTQFASDNNITFINQDGAEVGLRAGVSIDTEGYVVAAFSNGATQRIWKLPVATFADPNSLQARNGNAYAQTSTSGEFNLREANTGGAGRIEPAALEGSNVDLGEEFSTMITTQSAYSASARVITTANEMLDELLRIKR